MLYCQRQSGIYRLTCKICDSLYIGKTGRALSITVFDHCTAYNIQKKKTVSVMEAHCLDKNHPFDSVTAKLIRPCLKGNMLNCLEEMETISVFSSNNDNLLNDLSVTFVSSFVR